MPRMRTWLVFLAGPPYPDSSAGRAQRLLEREAARPLGLGWGLCRLRALDRLFPVRLRGWRLERVTAWPVEACYSLCAGERVTLGGPEGDRDG